VTDFSTLGHDPRISVHSRVQEFLGFRARAGTVSPVRLQSARGVSARCPNQLRIRASCQPYDAGQPPRFGTR
jgi:hypothetical protein